MIASPAALALIQAFESCILSAYPDPGSELGQACEHLCHDLIEYRNVPRWQLLKAAPVTIGWGHAGPSIALGDQISQETADALLRLDAKYAEMSLTGLDLTQPQYDALVSFIFNIGHEAFAESTLLKLLKAGDYEAAADQFLIWDHSHGKVLPGLLMRRRAERALFLGKSEVAV